MIGQLAGAAMSATPAGAAMGAIGSLAGAIGGDSQPATSSATSGDATQNTAFKAAFGDTFGAFNFSPSNAIGQKTTANAGGVSLPVIIGGVGLALTLVLILTRQKG